MTHLLALPVGTELVGDYRIERVIGAGGFGITYLAREHSLDRLITIKEYFPSDFATRGSGNDACPCSRDCAEDYKWGLDRFIDEAKTLAKFDHPNIVRVYRYFRLNNTGYIVTQFEEGMSFKAWLERLGRAPRQHELDRLLAALLNALELVHDAEFLHRDIAPDNIIIRKDGDPVLIDFGSARGEIAQHSRTISALVKPGYSPYEQYAETCRAQGPWTDIYALAATLYYAISGKRPSDAPTRIVDDDLLPACKVARGKYRPGFLNAIDTALRLKVDMRPQSVSAWREALFASMPSVASQTALPAARSMNHGATPPPLPAQAQRQRVGSAAAQSRRAAKRRAAPRPRPIRQKRTARLRPLLVKAMIIIGIASAAAAMQHQFPQIEKHGLALLSAMRKDPALVRRIEGHDGLISSIAFSGNGKRIVSTGADATIKIWDLRTGGLIRTIATADGPAPALAVEGNRAATGHSDGTTILWDLETGAKLGSFKRNEAAISSLTFAGTTQRIATAAHDRTVTLWDSGAAEDGPVRVVRKHSNAVQAIAYSGQGSYIASGGADKTVRLWNADTLRPLRRYRNLPDFVTSLAFSADGRRLAAACLDGKVWIFGTNSTRKLRVLRGHDARVTAMAFSPDNRYVATSSLDGSARIWNAKTGRQLRKISGHAGAAGSVAFSPDGRFLVSAGADGIIRIWRTAELVARPGKADGSGATG